MKTIETFATVASDGQLVLQLQAPPDLPPGDYKVVVMIEDKPAEEITPRPVLDFPAFSVGSWPADLSLRREELYDDEF